MEIHGCPCILPSLQGIDKLFGNGLAKADVVTAAAPEPTMSAWERVEKSIKLPVVFQSKRRGLPPAVRIYVQIYFSDLFVRSCCHHSHSCQSHQDCNSWLKCTWPQLSWWHAQMLSPGLLLKERLVSALAGLEFSILKDDLSMSYLQNTIQMSKYTAGVHINA